MRLVQTVLVMAATAAMMWAEPIGAGIYKGTGEGASANGDFRVALTKADGGEWTGGVVFTMSGQTVNCKVTSLKVDGSKLKMVYSFDLQGTMLESTLGGKYRTQVSGDGSAVDEGSWKTKSDK